MDTSLFDALDSTWDRLTELKEDVLAQGFTSAQFSATIENLGTDPVRASAHFQAHGFVPDARWLAKCRDKA